jgi:hypothetical protein
MTVKITGPYGVTSHNVAWYVLLCTNVSDEPNTLIFEVQDARRKQNILLSLWNFCIKPHHCTLQNTVILISIITGTSNLRK